MQAFRLIGDWRQEVSLGETMLSSHRRSSRSLYQNFCRLACPLGLVLGWEALAKTVVDHTCSYHRMIPRTGLFAKTQTPYVDFAFEFRQWLCEVSG